MGQSAFGIETQYIPEPFPLVVKGCVAIAMHQIIVMLRSQKRVFPCPRTDGLPL